MKNKIKYIIFGIIELTAIIVIANQDLKYVGYVLVVSFITSVLLFIFSFFTKNTTEEHLFICSGIIMFVIFALLLLFSADNRYDAIVEKYKPKEIIRQRTQIVLIGENTVATSTELNIYTSNSENLRICRDKYYTALNELKYSTLYICNK